MTTDGLNLLQSYWFEYFDPSIVGGGVSWIWNVEFGIVNRGIYRGMAPKLDPWNALRGR